MRSLVCTGHSEGLEWCPGIIFSCTLEFVVGCWHSQQSFKISDVQRAAPLGTGEAMPATNLKTIIIHYTSHEQQDFESGGICVQMILFQDARPEDDNQFFNMFSML